MGHGGRHRRHPAHGQSRLKGITPGGIAYGAYQHYHTGSEAHTRAFLWAEGLGTLVSDEPGPAGGGAYEYLTDVWVNDHGLAVGQGRLRGSGAGVVCFGTVAGLASPGGGVRVTDLTRLPETGRYRLSFSADTAVRITLQFSADLSTWRDGQTMDAAAGASHMDIEADTAAPPNQYWRLKTTP